MDVQALQSERAWHVPIHSMRQPNILNIKGWCTHLQHEVRRSPARKPS